MGQKGRMAVKLKNNIHNGKRGERAKKGWKEKWKKGH